MFDKHVHVSAVGADHHHYHRSEVTEKRAPTDESVRLLREMEQSAMNSVLGTVRLQGSPVDCVIFHKRNPLTDEDQFVMRYKLGAVTREVKYDHQRVGREDELEAIARGLRESLASDIAGALLVRPLGTMLGKFTRLAR